MFGPDTKAKTFERFVRLGFLHNPAKSAETLASAFWDMYHTDPRRFEPYEPVSQPLIGTKVVQKPESERLIWFKPPRIWDTWIREASVLAVWPMQNIESKSIFIFQMDQIGKVT